MQPFSSRPTPVVVLSGLTRNTLEPIELSITFGLPEPALVRHELDPAAGSVTRIVSDHTGIVEREVVPLDHAGLTCALRHEIVPTLTRLAESGRWSSLVLSLPAATQPKPLVDAIAGMIQVSAPVRRAIRLGSVVTAVEAECLVDDLFGDDLLRERDGVRHAGDLRAVGGVLADAVEYADVLALADGHNTPPALATAVLDELRRPDSLVIRDAAELGTRPAYRAHREHVGASRSPHPGVAARRHACGRGGRRVHRDVACRRGGRSLVAARRHLASLSS